MINNIYMIWQVMLPLEYQVRQQARLRVNKKASKQTNRVRETESERAQMRKSQTEREHKPKVKVRISNIFGYREVIAIADLPVIYVMYECVCAQCVESACHWIIITASPNVRRRSRRRGPFDARLAWFNIDACVKLPDLFYDSTHQPRTQLIRL